MALIFGLFLTNPAPICVLDEVDAPLDDANIDRFCGLLDRMTRETDTRYLIVTHNAVTMSRMHRPVRRDDDRTRRQPAGVGGFAGGGDVAGGGVMPRFKTPT